MVITTTLWLRLACILLIKGAISHSVSVLLKRFKENLYTGTSVTITGIKNRNSDHSCGLTIVANGEDCV